jgi:hypothetical protein
MVLNGVHQQRRQVPLDGNDGAGTGMVGIENPPLGSQEIDVLRLSDADGIEKLISEESVEDRLAHVVQ